MANAERGEVGFEALGRAWKLKLGTTAMCEIETLTGKPITEVAVLLSDEATATMTLMRAVFWGGLQHHHDGATLRDAADIIDELGNEEAGRLIGAGFNLAQSQGGKGSASARPRKAAAR
jgi:2-keto-3-deoxy-6-phosphogluconate aldolase